MKRRSFLASSIYLAVLGKVFPALALPQSERASSAGDLSNDLVRDPLRPQYHLLPQAGFVGDPCAPRFFRGEYHVFFHGSFGGRGWHHAVSPDLVHWKHLPIALSPTDHGYDAYGTFTGGVLPGGSGASVIYTGVTKVPRGQETIRAEGLREVQCIATSMDNDLTTWAKRPKPVIDGPPQGLKVTGFRDPFSWKDGDTWYLGVGSGFPQVGGAVLLYRSRDTYSWEYLHPLAQGIWNGQSFSNPVPSGEMWECPDFFALGDKYVLLYSTEHTTRWEVGTFDKVKLLFRPEKKGILDNGALYAPRSMASDDGRRILWGWVQETRPSADIKQAGWSGAISLPRVLTLAADGTLEMEVVEEFAALRHNSSEIKEPRTATELSEFLSKLTIKDRAVEIIVTFVAGEEACVFELQLLSSGGTTSLLALSYSRTNGEPFVAIADRLLPLKPDSESRSTLHIWVDGSIIETFLDKRQVITTRTYEAPIGSGEIRLAWTGPYELVKEIVVYSIQPISRDRLTT